MADDQRLDRRPVEPDAAIRRQIIALMADVFQCDLEPTLRDVRRESIGGWDSFNHFHLIQVLEETFQLSLTDDEAAGIDSLQDIERVLASREAP